MKILEETIKLQVQQHFQSQSSMYQKRFFVPDLSAQFRSELADTSFRYAFVAESPHVSEVSPVNTSERRPLCGLAGQKWWGLLSEIFEESAAEDLSLSYLVDFCKRHRIAVLNAVQFPLDQNIIKHFPNADPVVNLGFTKSPGPFTYKKLKNTKKLQNQIQLLKKRLDHPSIQDTPIICLGNDSLWFVEQALGKNSNRIYQKIPHPSAWWRRGGLFGRTAKEQLQLLFSN